MVVQPGKPLGALVWKKSLCTICHLGSIQRGQCTPQSETMQQRVAPAPCPEHTRSAARGRSNIKSDCYQASPPPPMEAQQNGRIRKFNYWHQQGSGQEKQALLQMAGREGKNKLQSKMILAFSHRKGYSQGLKPRIRLSFNPPALLLTVWYTRLTLFLASLPSLSCVSTGTILFSILKFFCVSWINAL